MGAPLNLLYEDATERIAERVRRQVGGGRYVATCATASLRDEIEAALEARLGEGAVIRVTLAEGEDPWNAVRQLQLARSTPVERTLYVLWGVHGEGPEGPEHPYAQLNLARDAWAGSGTHLLVWLDGLGEIPRFAKLAPDLWSMRSLVEEFISLGDFPVAEPAEEDAGPRDEDEVQRLQEELKTFDGDEERRRWLAIRLSLLLRKRNRVVEAWRVLGPDAHNPRDPRLEEETFYALRAIARPGASRRVGARLIRQETPGRPPEVSRGVAARLAFDMGDHERGIELALLAWSAPFGNERVRANGLADLATSQVRLGRVADAEQTLARLAETGAEDRDALEMAVRRRIAAARGDLVGAVAAGLTAASRLGQAGRLRHASWDLRSSAAWLLELGYPHLAGSVSCAEPGAADEIRAERAIEEVTLAEGGASGDTGVLVGAAVREITTSARSWPSRALAAESLLRLYDAVELTPQAFSAILACANHLHKVCAADEDHEPLGIVDGVITQLHLSRSDPKRAAHYAKHLLAWAKEWRGRREAIEVRCLLADIAVALDKLDAARAHADEAVTLARAGLSLFDLSLALQLRARVCVARGEIDLAHAALVEALDAVRVEGLRPEMIRLHLRLAELPEGEDRAAQAREALALARICRLIHEEARALLRLAELAPTPWGPRDRASFARAARIVRELGPRSLLPTVERLAPRAEPEGTAARP